MSVASCTTRPKVGRPRAWRLEPVGPTCLMSGNAPTVAPRKAIFKCTSSLRRLLTFGSGLADRPPLGVSQMKAYLLLQLLPAGDDRSRLQGHGGELHHAV